ncbi:hypothetical protein IRJ41_009626 [Triplophysa rosa]|uniref:Centriolar coiled-coil protein of 110 kDa n=1 Tax=Triplophysa rosa TaxID=992332 RepID=A0A9W7TE47_TRIRA|nr:hypothetical protein IRJ41_009626 [Triplophysa rosa]
MESYDEFCSRALNTLLRARACSTASQQQRAHASNIQFHGRRLLEPVLSEELRVQMAEERQTAVQRDRKRQTRQTDALLERVHNILHNIHLRKLQNESDRAVTCTADLSPTLRPKTSSGSVPLQNQNLSTSSSLKKETLRLLNQRMEREKNIGPERFTSPSPDSVLSGLSRSLTGSYARLPCPQPSRSPLAHRARPSRPSNILISCPVSESELSPNTSECESHPSEVTTPGAPWNCSELSDRQLSVISSTPSSTNSQKRVQSSLSGTPPDEKAKPGRRSPPAPLNRSYDVESPSPSLIRPQVEFTPSSGSDGPVSCTLQPDGGFARRPLEGRMNVKQNWTAETADEQETETPSECLEREHIRLSVQHVKGFCRLNAVARGFLTRRLLQTDKIKHLRKTVQDSREFLRSFQSHSHLKRISISSQDLSQTESIFSHSEDTREKKTQATKDFKGDAQEFLSIKGSEVLCQCEWSHAAERCETERRACGVFSHTASLIT